MHFPTNHTDIFLQPRFFNSPWLSRHNINWSELTRFGTLKTYKKNTIIQSACSEPASEIAYLTKGRVRVSVITEQGEEKIMLVIDEGNLLDATSIIDNIPSHLVTTTLTDCQVYWIPKAVLLDLIETNAAFAKMLLLDMSRKNRILISHVEDMTFMNSSARIAKCLYRLANDYGVPHENGTRLTIKFTHHEMAIFTGTCRVTVTNILEKMKAAGVISKNHHYWLIHNLDALKTLIATSR